MNDSRVARRWALAATILAAVVFGLVALVWVPWQPVPGGSPPAAPVGSVFTSAQIEQGETYAAATRPWSLGAVVVGLVVASVVGFTRQGRRLVDLLPGPWWLQVVQAVMVVSLLGRVATLPSSVAVQRHRLAAGLSNQSWPAFARDVTVSEVISIAATSVAMLALVGVARRWKRAWPAIAASVVGTLVVMASFVYPVLVEPLFNDFVPLEQGELRSAIVDLADEEGVEVDDVLVADASRRTTTLNAYVSGFGATRRVVVYDTLVDSLSREEALSVVAHELAHAKTDDVVLGTTLGALGSVLGVGLLGLFLTRRSGSVSMADPRSVPLILALVVWASLVTAPVQNGISRRIETRADVSALTAMGTSEAFVEMQRTLALRSLADPTPPRWLHWWWGSHPTVLQRVGLADSFDAGNDDDPAR